MHDKPDSACRIHSTCPDESDQQPNDGANEHGAGNGPNHDASHYSPRLPAPADSPAGPASGGDRDGGLGGSGAAGGEGDDGGGGGGAAAGAWAPAPRVPGNRLLVAPVSAIHEPHRCRVDLGDGKLASSLRQ